MEVIDGLKMMQAINLESIWSSLDKKQRKGDQKLIVFGIVTFLSGIKNKK